MSPRTTEPQPQNRWVVYILRCADGSLYTGVTTNLARRLKEHNSLAIGARYTRARRPVSLAHAEYAVSRSAACRREYQIKLLSRTEKERLLSGLDSSMDQKGNCL